MLPVKDKQENFTRIDHIRRDYFLWRMNPQCFVGSDENELKIKFTLHVLFLLILRLTDDVLVFTSVLMFPISVSLQEEDLHAELCGR